MKEKNMSVLLGAAYTSVSFLKTLFPFVKAKENLCIIAFIVASTLIFIFIGKPATLLILAGSLNGLILPVTLATILIASKRKTIVGEYKHSQVLFILGWVVTIATAYIGINSLKSLLTIFR